MSAAPAPTIARFGQVRVDGSPRRVQAMRRAYAVGLALIVLGALTHTPVALALGAVGVNLGTVYRYLVVALDLQGLDTPLLARPERATHLAARR